MYVACHFCWPAETSQHSWKKTLKSVYITLNADLTQVFKIENMLPAFKGGAIYQSTILIT